MEMYLLNFPYLSLEFLHYYAMIIYQYSTGCEVNLNNVSDYNLMVTFDEKKRMQKSNN